MWRFFDDFKNNDGLQRFGKGRTAASALLPGKFCPLPFRASVLIGLNQGSLAVFPNGQLNFLVAIHHEWPPLNNGFAYRLTGDHQ